MVRGGGEDKSQNIFKKYSTISNNSLFLCHFNVLIRPVVEGIMDLPKRPIVLESNN